MLAHQTPRVLVHFNSQDVPFFFKPFCAHANVDFQPSEYFRVVAHLHSCRVLCVVDDGVPVGACSSHDISAPLSQQVWDVD